MPAPFAAAAAAADVLLPAQAAARGHIGCQTSHAYGTACCCCC
jgi:hypothetical protein